MSVSNSQKMSLEERLVQHIKETQLGALADDEAALTELTKRALHEALFKGQRVNDGTEYHPRWNEKDSLVVQTARELAKTYLEKVAQEIIDDMMKDEKTREAIRQAAMCILPSVIQNGLQNTLSQIAHEGGKAGIEILKNAGIIDPNKHYGY